MDDQLKEYIITLKNKDDLAEFYKDMETLRSTAYNCMPERAVDCQLRRPLSRNTHYLLTAEEAETLRQDPRIVAVSLLPKELGLTVRPHWTQTSAEWNKSSVTSATHINWGLLRVLEGQQIENWGRDNVVNQTATITVNEEGRNVDVIIVDGHINPDHSEFAVNPDGTGGSRVIQLDWHTLTPTVAGIDDDVAQLLTTSYVYSPYDGNNNNHGCHVAGTVAGITQGWARKSNIYNINPYSNNPNGLDELVLFDYIRAFHASKPINLATGRRNPTIMNHSWGYGYTLDQTSLPITSINYRGATINGPFTNAELKSYGIDAVNTTVYMPADYPALNADAEDAIADGIIMVSAAANDSTKVDVPGGLDYDNTFTIIFSGAPYIDYYHRGSSPGNAIGSICVGSIDSQSTDLKADYSNTGPRIDIWAPGTDIISSTNSGGINDPRGVGFLNKYSGTSMASPQVCGVLACILEIYPDMTPAEALEYVVKYAKVNQITNTNGTYDDVTSLQGAPNLFLYYNQERRSQGSVYPKLNYKTRPSSGILWPRKRTFGRR